MRHAATVVLIALLLSLASFGKSHAGERWTSAKRAQRVRYQSLQPGISWSIHENLLTIRAAASRFNVSSSTMRCIAYRESRYNEDAYNSYSGASGLLQHLQRYWPGRVDSYNRSVGPVLDVKPNASPFSARANSLVSAWYARRYGWGAWAGEGCA